jgi:hypothetical protein
MIQNYDIFSGRNKSDAVWVDAVQGLELASKLMRTIAKDKPGAYFVFCARTNKILNAIDTSSDLQSSVSTPARTLSSHERWMDWVIESNIAVYTCSNCGWTLKLALHKDSKPGKLFQQHVCQEYPRTTEKL